MLLTGFGATAVAAPHKVDASSAFSHHYRLAMQKVNAESWEDAIVEFQRAYEVRETPRPELHLYIARAQLRLLRGQQALDAYQRFLNEVKEPKPEQMKAVTTGIAQAKEQIELQLQRERLTAQEAALTARGRQQQSEHAEKVDDAGKGQTAKAAETNRATDETVRPAEQKVAVMARNGKTSYTVAVGTDAMCTVPCQLRALPGEQQVTVMGPGTKRFQRSAIFPTGPSQLQVQHFTLSRAIAGPILLALSAPFLAGGALTLKGASDHQIDPAAIAGSSTLFLHGAVFFLTGIGQLAAIKRNSISVVPIGVKVAARASSPQLTNFSIAPLTERKGVLASASFRF